MDLKKVKADNAVWNILAIVFSILGIIFFMLGVIFVCIQSAGWYEEGYMLGSGGLNGGVASLLLGKAAFSLLGMSFAVLGILFLISAICFIVLAVRRTRQLREVAAQGYYVMAQVIGWEIDRHVRVNRQYARRLCCVYTDEYGNDHEFISRCCFFARPDSLAQSEGRLVRVYMKRDEYTRYYVDVDTLTKI